MFLEVIPAEPAALPVVSRISRRPPNRHSAREELCQLGGIPDGGQDAVLVLGINFGVDHHSRPAGRQPEPCRLSGFRREIERGRQPGEPTEVFSTIVTAATPIAVSSGHPLIKIRLAS